jgi:thiopeptide-type bacteriocin biosynthesis protein
MTLVGEARSRAGMTRPRDGDRLYDAMEPVLVRVPLLPVDVGRQLVRDLRGTSGDALADAVDAWAGGRVRAALGVASPDFVRALRRPNPSERERAKLRSKLVRYVVRMSTRPTPFGLFAGVATADWATTTTIALAPDPPRARTRPDAGWLLEFTAELEARPEIRRDLKWYANPCAFVRSDRVFLPERASPAPAADSAATSVSVRATGVVRRVLSLARQPTPYAELVDEILRQPGADMEKAHTLLDQLWIQTLLLTDLRPSLLSSDPARSVLERLATVPAAGEARRRLQAVLDHHAAQDRRTWSASPDTHDDESAPPTQVDMAWPLHARGITRAIADDTTRAAELLLRLTPSPRGPAQLAAFRSAFEARYGPDREVSVLEALDPNFGIGPPSRHAAASTVDPARLAVRNKTLRTLAADAWRDRRLVVELDEATMQRLETWPLDPATAPTSLDLSVLVAAGSAVDIDAGRYQLVIGPNLGAAAAGRNLGRFADLLACAPALESVGRFEQEHAPDRLWAEVTYVPQRLRSANVTIRPLVRDYEIPVGTVPSVDGDHAIPVDELVVGVSERDLYLRWPRAGADVVPCAGHMLNSVQAPDVCRFLDELSRGGTAQISSFDWGPAWGLPFLPRVQAGRIVLCLAQWIIDADTVRSSLGLDHAERFLTDLAAWRERFQVPQHVYLAVGDNRLLLDLDDAEHASELRHELRGLRDGGQLLLQEALPGPEHAWLPGPGGGFASEFVVPLVLRQPATRSRSAPRRPAETSINRVRAPGSDWLFAKLYVPTCFEEDVIVGPLRDFAEATRLSGLSSGWFFLRYTDPEPHLRVRFAGPPDGLLSDLLPQLSAWANELMEDGRCTRFVLDTYERELERYGGPAGMALAEALFCADSRAVVELLAARADGTLPLDPITLAVLTIDDLLAGLGLDTAERLAWYEDNATTTPEVGAQYRQRQRELRALLGDANELARRPGGDLVVGALAARRPTAIDVGREIDCLVAVDTLTQPKTKLVRSFVHLHCNRLAARGEPIEPYALGLLRRVWHGLARSAR